MSDPAASNSPSTELITVSLSEWSGPDRAAAATPRTQAGRYYHPYSHPNAKAQPQRPKPPTKYPRRLWNHALEKPLFSGLELTTLGVPQRRPIYVASLEAHIDRMHTQLLSLGSEYYPVPLPELDSFIGLNSKTCKGMIAGLQNDLAFARDRLLDLQQVNEELESRLYARGV
ncbi:hypothetical protein C8F04DRAFT_1256156 [Mycena alexandri]|uniref:Uncharacterized protein n=1 Tax=Mycena alexandri TaxID=1745969 RepID=A0AAD6T2B3_9AGAR|nr:hypothetical protein C8F04DRAFT_1256156 [Mycena alexandri]